MIKHFTLEKIAKKYYFNLPSAQKQKLLHVTKQQFINNNSSRKKYQKKALKKDAV